MFLQFSELPKLEFDHRLTSQTLKAGQNLNLDLNLSGYPKPNVEWLYNDVPIRSSSNVEVMTSDINTSLRVKGVGKDKQGQYKVRISNIAGEQTAVFDVSVKGELLHLLDNHLYNFNFENIFDC